MRTVTRPRHRQQGAIAIVFGLALVVLVAAGGLALDLGHLYVLKSELQNAADSAALAGAKEINLSAAGITNAVTKAKSFSQKNKYNFGSDVVLADANISFGGSPDGPWVTVGEAIASPAGKSFIQIDTGAKAVDTYLMRVAGVDTVSSRGVAVAGRFVVDITPLGLCAIDAGNRTGALELAGAPGTFELLEYGFRRGLAYNIKDMGPVAGSADAMLLSPTATSTSCEPSESSAAFTAPFLCQGNSTVASGLATHVYTNTGVQATPVERAINSRFGLYPGGSACSPVTAPPDVNVKSYAYETADGAGGPKDWMAPDPSQQSLALDPDSHLPLAAPTAAQMGALWSYSRPVRALGSAGSYTAGAAFEPGDWSDLYPGGMATESYPAGAGASPYAQTSGKYYETKAGYTAGARRRLMNIAIIDCAGVGGGSMSCKKLPLLGVGRFFLQAPVNLNGATPSFFVEFAGLIEPVPNSEIKLYR